MHTFCVLRLSFQPILRDIGLSLFPIKAIILFYDSSISECKNNNRMGCFFVFFAIVSVFIVAALNNLSITSIK